MKQLIPYGGILFCINLVAVTNVLAVVEKDPPKEERTAELTCNINIMPDTVACGQGVGHITLHADIKCITASGTACEDVGLVWRPEVSGVNGGLPELEQQGATTTGLIFSTQLNGESIESFNVKLVVTSAANNLKEISNTPVTVGECSHDCNGELGGNAVEDSCGICGGDGSTCSDCAGVPYGEATYDACGVCNGDGSSCADCNGVPNGEALYDACGVCDGDGSSCLDCPQGIDECGICGGDNTSCLLCESRDISPSQFELDGAAQNLNTLIIKGVNVLRRTRGRSTAFQNLMNTAHEAYLKSWTTISSSRRGPAITIFSLGASCAFLNSADSWPRPRARWAMACRPPSARSARSRTKR